MKIEKNENSQIVKTTFLIAHCHLRLYHHVKIHEIYELLSLYRPVVDKKI